ncbi:hypothetical protein WN51_00351 [Melipona quadrifasciata]|uniref:Uncharacterized protein n=1 Tax=Melipona quadrifasciata TaxID=166423 RepID=A0A0M8ZXP2_9HYME|nr:hypothetical protein WN51_00351 [Melipona quadrifasciata]
MATHNEKFSNTVSMANTTLIVRAPLPLHKQQQLPIYDVFKRQDEVNGAKDASPAAKRVARSGAAMAEVTFIRNPYPLPDVVREGVWLRQPVLGSKVSPKDRDWSAKLKAHERLFAHHTLNSIRRDNRLQRSQVPEDALDLALTTVYVHSRDTLVPKSYVPVQPETLGQRTWRVLKNQIENHGNLIESDPFRSRGQIQKELERKNTSVYRLELGIHKQLERTSFRGRLVHGGQGIDLMAQDSKSSQVTTLMTNSYNPFDKIDSLTNEDSYNFRSYVWLNEHIIKHNQGAVFNWQQGLTTNLALAKFYAKKLETELPAKFANPYFGILLETLFQTSTLCFFIVRNRLAIVGGSSTLARRIIEMILSRASSIQRNDQREFN